jgi:hypothetical protein
MCLPNVPHPLLPEWCCIVLYDPAPYRRLHAESWRARRL